MISFHPSYTEEKKDELKALKTKLLLLWVKQDQFHSWSKGRKMIATIPHYNRYEAIIDLKKFNADIPKNTYTAISDKVTEPIVRFLTGVNYLEAASEVTQMKTQAVENTKGKAITQVQTLAFKEELNTQELQEMNKKVSESTLAVEEALSMIGKYGIQELIKSRLNKSHSWSHDVDILLLKLPLFAELLET